MATPLKYKEMNDFHQAVKHDVAIQIAEDKKGGKVIPIHLH
jgi:hypothetical protein